MATIKANPSFSAETAAAALNKAMKGLGTNEASIIEVLSSHNLAQRLKIANQYETSYGKSLVSIFKKEMRGDLLDTVLALMEPTTAYLARELRAAIKGPGTDETVLIEIICPRTNAEIKGIKEAYEQAYSRDLGHDVSGETRGDFKRLLISQLSGNRDESTKVDKSKAEEEAKELIQAGEGRWGTDESVFNRILCTRSFAQLRETFDKYKEIAGHDIESAIRKETKGQVRAGYLTVVSYAQDAPAFFAYRLYKSMRGVGTNDKMLVRLVVSRSEIDLAKVADSYSELYKTTLSAAIKSDTRGDYKNLLLAIVGGR